MSRTPGVTWMAILCLIYGAILLISLPATLMFAGEYGFVVWRGSIYTVLAVLIIVSGIGLLAQKSWAVLPGRIYALGHLAMGLVLVVQGSMIVARGLLPGNPIGVRAVCIGLIITVVFQVLWPLAVLRFYAQRPVLERLRGGSSGRATPGARD